MVQLQKTVFMALGIFFMLSTRDVFGTQNPHKENTEIVLTPADQLILDRIDNLWITMLGGFIGVMGFIGALVFWDICTFMKRAKYEMRLELKEDRKKMDGILAALKKLDVRFPEVGEALRSFGLL